MPKSLTISIPTPCHEDWSKMTQEQQGRFCGSCQKTVVDFTLMTDGQILEFVQKNKGGACGRFTGDQLNRPLVEPLQPKWYMAAMWKYMLGGFLIFKGVQGKAQVLNGVTLRAASKLHIKQDTTPSVFKDSKITLGMISNVYYKEPLKWIGKIQDDIGNPIANASVMLKGTNTIVTTNSNGKFIIEVRKGELPEVEVTAIGFETKVFDIKKSGFVLTLIKSKEEIVFAGFFITKTDDEKETPIIETKIIRYTIIDERNGMPIPNATISVIKKGETSTYTADKKGGFKLKGLKDDERVKLTVSAAGYKNYTVVVEANSFDKHRNKETIVLQNESEKLQGRATMGIVDFVRFVPKGDSNMLTLPPAICNVAIIDTKVKDNKIKETKAPITNSNNLDVTVFPNPITVGNSLQINFIAKQEETVKIALLDIDGKIITTTNYKTVVGSNSTKITMPIAIAAQQVVVQIVNRKEIVLSSKIVLVTN